MSAPIVPQRPTRSHETAAETADASLMPSIPPRPARSRSARREQAARSPLNDPPFQAPSLSPSAENGGHGRAPEQIMKRPSVASLPLIGQEGSEYASLEQVHQLKDNVIESPQTPGDTRLVAGDLPLHAPKASVPSHSTQSEVPAVVRTEKDTHHAGLDESDMSLHRISTRSREFRPSSSGLSRELTRSTSRPASLLQEEEEHGIPHIGQYVPMYPHAGDVQAPSPGPFVSPGTPGDGSRPTTSNGRRRSLQGFQGPPGSYGLHGHGLVSQDKFEKAWYQKHPEELVKEEGSTHSPYAALPRPEWALSTEELNKLVHDHKEAGGFGTSDNVISVPTEAIGYKASEEYSSRMNSPALKPVKSRPESQSYVESPLRKVFTGDGKEKDPIDDDKVHLDPPRHQGDKYTGAGYDPPTEDLGPDGGNTTEKGGWIDEKGSGMPILASDELEKRQGSAFLQPAVAPEALSWGDGDYYSENEDLLPPWQRRKGSASGRNNRRPTSRPSSRPSSSRLPESARTPLNDVEEYEPLFKDDEDKEDEKRRLMKQKRHELEKMRFPSQDIWEDAPNSLQLHTTVGGPQMPEEVTLDRSKAVAGSHFETPEQEAKRRGEITEGERPSFLQSHSSTYAKPKFNAGVQNELSRPGMKHRFPSQDVWEDSPHSLQLETTVGSEEAKMTSPSGATVPAENNLAAGFIAADKSMAASVEHPSIPPRPARTAASTQPVVPSRPAAKIKEAPVISDKPKPVVPPRPAKASADEPDGGVALKKTTSASSAGSFEAGSPPEQPGLKTKPPVPARPGQGSKIASLKAGFMNDLNNRLQLGPKPPKPAAQAEAETEITEDKAPLSDARKGRARGPARRTPAVAAASSAPAETSSSTASWGFSSPASLWHISNSGLNVHATAAPLHHVQKVASDLEEAPTASPLATNTAGDSLQEFSEAPKIMAGELAHQSDAVMDTRAANEDLANAQELLSHEKVTIGNEGDMPDPAEPEPASETGLSDPVVTVGDNAPET